jgi:hypothetical protein
VIMLPYHVTVVVPTTCWTREVPVESSSRDMGVENRAAELHDRAISSYVGVGIPAFQVGSRSSSMLPLGSKK